MSSWSRPLLLTLSCALVFCAGSRAAEPAGVPARGDRMLRAYFQAQVKDIAGHCLTDLTTRADWERRRPELRRQFLDMMGLWPLPPRTDLQPVVTGAETGDGFVVEKLHFQSLPGLYVTANLYRPTAVAKPLPGILYVCGHGAVIFDGISYGNKVSYQHHGMWLARHGYVCLMLDTLQLGELQGLHHGTHNLGMWWWQTLGYTPAGIECWNGLRGLDYLQSRKEVDGARLGVTGRSGGGATSWWVAAADDRPTCIIPVAGIADLEAHVVDGASARFRNGVVSGHCDCMYPVNAYRWDFPLVAALCAPRPLMLGNSDADEIFPVPGYRRLAEKVRQVYALYGADEKFALLETAGPHKDTPELRVGAYRWLNRWLKGDSGPVTDELPEKWSPDRLKVLQRAPEDAINATVHETFLKPAPVPELPPQDKAAAWWQEQSRRWKEELTRQTFAGWPVKPGPLEVKPAGEAADGGLKVRAWDFQSEEGVDLRLWLLSAAGAAGAAGAGAPRRVVLEAVDEAGWQALARDLGPAFQEILQRDGPATRDETALRRRLEELPAGTVRAILAPRGVGPTRWSAAGTAADNHVRRAFALVGQTLDGQRVWDVRRAVQALGQDGELKGKPLTLEGRGPMAGVLLYAALYEPAATRLVLREPPASHREGPTLLNVRRILDLPQAVALAEPREVELHVADAAAARAWTWPEHLQEILGRKFLRIRLK